MAYISKGTQLMYRLTQTTDNISGRIASYIIIHINPFTRRYNLNRPYLAHRFNCSIRTVDNGIHLIKQLKYYDVHPKYVAINYKRFKNDQKEGNQNANN